VPRVFVLASLSAKSFASELQREIAPWYSKSPGIKMSDTVQFAKDEVV